MARTTTITPLYDRLLCQRVEAAAYTKGAGLFIPEAARERPQEALVIAVGEGRRNDAGEFLPPRAKPGDHVLVGKYAGAEVSIDDAMYLVVREDEVLGVVTVTGEEDPEDVIDTP